MRVLELLGSFERDLEHFGEIPTVRTYPARASLEFESGMALVVDVRMRWEKATWPLAICIFTPHNRSLTSFLPVITISPKKEVSYSNSSATSANNLF